jgi:hypothetical protein
MAEFIIFIVIPGILVFLVLIGLFGRPGISHKPGPGLTRPLPGEPYGRWTPKPGDYDYDQE